MHKANRAEKEQTPTFSFANGRNTLNFVWLLYVWKNVFGYLWI